MIRQKLLISAMLCFLSLASHATVIWYAVATVTNATSPSVWESHAFDITSFIAGVSSAAISFDHRNDAPNPPFTPNSTTANVDFGIDNVTGDFFARFAYAGGFDTSHFRDFQLLVDGILYRDQYGIFNNHLGDEYLGTAQQGGGTAHNILGDNGPAAAIYSFSISNVSEPSTIVLLILGVTALALRLRLKQNMM